MRNRFQKILQPSDTTVLLGVFAFALAVGCLVALLFDQPFDLMP